MIDPQMDPYVEWIAREAKRPVAVDPMAVQRIMGAVRAEPAPRKARLSWRRLLEARPLSVSPALGAALAAALVGIGVFVGAQFSRGGQFPVTGPAPQVPEPQAPKSDTVRVIKFVLVAPQAATVSLVGDFNEWDAKATPMTRTPTGGMWSVAVPLTPGRHVYAFVVNGANGTQWVADPSAPLAPEDGLGAPNSVVLVGGSSS
jgi:hypothetical protein